MKRNEDPATLDTLNDLLRGELSAVETYNQALEVVARDSDNRKDLEECQSSHEDRVLRLRSEILERGGNPAEGSGLWGEFAKLVEGGAKLGGPKMAIGALEAGEDHGLKEYHQLLPKLEISARSFVSMDIYPQQVRTHSILSALKSAISGPGIRA
jgi:demethoxyubiquinone hydroxylase (CLK1/Coq7/Cat5 family)